LSRESLFFAASRVRAQNMSGKLLLAPSLRHGEPQSETNRQYKSRRKITLQRRRGRRLEHIANRHFLLQIEAGLLAQYLRSDG